MTLSKFFRKTGVNFSEMYGSFGDITAATL